MTVEAIAELARQFGFGGAGLCAFAPLESCLLPVRSRSRLPQRASAVIVLAAGYYTGSDEQRNVALYAVPDDYHNVLMPRLTQICAVLESKYMGASFVPFVDSSPIPEIMAAQLAGLGQAGRNGLLINPMYKNYCFICEIVTNADILEYDSRGNARKSYESQKLCSGCGLCVSACPTGALSSGGLDAAICRSQITQKKGGLTDWERAQIRDGKMAWGCDLCMQACPLNSAAQKSGIDAFYENRTAWLTAERLDELCKRKSYGFRGAGVLRRNLQILAEGNCDKK